MASLELLRRAFPRPALVLLVVLCVVGLAYCFLVRFPTARALYLGISAFHRSYEFAALLTMPKLPTFARATHTAQ